MSSLLDQLKVVLPEANELQLNMTVMLVREALKEELKTERKRDLARTRKRHQRDRERDISVTKTGHVTPVSPLDPPSSEISLFSDLDPDLRIPSKPDQRDPHSDEPALLTFPCDGKAKEFRVTEALRKQHAEAYPRLDVLGEYRKALVWVQADPGRKKTAGGMVKFLVRWLNTAQDSGRGRDISVTGNGQAMVQYRQLDAPPARNFREEATADAFARARAARQGGEP